MVIDVFECRWGIRSYTGASETEYGKALCLSLVSSVTSPTERGDGETQLRLNEQAGSEDPSFATFLARCLKDRPRGSTIRCAFILPAVEGYVIRSDIFRRRMILSDVSERVQDFMKPLQRVEAVSVDGNPKLSQLLESSSAAVLLKETAGGDHGFVHLLQELRDRLDFPWLSPEPIPRKRLVWFGGRTCPSDSHEIWSTAFCLGISLVIVDEPGHWLEDDSGPFAHYREAFVPMDMAADSGFPDRLLKTVQEIQKHKPVDGVIALTDARVAKAARACERLGLPTSPESAYLICTDKGATRKLEPGAQPAAVFANAEELRDTLQHGGLPAGLEYPLIVKPCMGWSSDGVTKVSSQDELLEAASKASGMHANGPLRQTAFLVERYIDGPEFDANFILLDGEVLFCEIADDFPSPGDRPGAAYKADFGETEDVSPSALPRTEQDMIRDSIHQSILRMGFTSGVFHCEGRVVDSSMRHDFSLPGVGDLRLAEGRQGGRKPWVYLHEINARTPALQIVVSTHCSYGVDYYAAYMLFATGDTARVKSLARPFRGAPQAHLGNITFPQEKAGIMKTPDLIQQLKDNHPEIGQSIVFSHTEVHGGQAVRGPITGALLFLGWAVVASKKSREDCLRLTNACRESLSYELE